MHELSPLQRVMLRDSLAAPSAGYHVEQVEIVFTPGTWRGQVLSAWAETVAQTEALRLSFLTDDDPRGEIEFVNSSEACQFDEGYDDSWLAKDRLRPLLIPHRAPWRAAYWPRDGRFIWTFHHALLDGRSIATVLQNFCQRLIGQNGTNLSLTIWKKPSSALLKKATELFNDEYPEQDFRTLDLFQVDTENGSALKFMGHDFRRKIDLFAAAIDVTVATILVWAWGQSLADETGVDSVVVEQVRCGAPQQHKAGFIMQTLPIVIPKLSMQQDAVISIKLFREQLLAMRAIENVTRGDFPFGVFPDVNHAGGSVIMIEHGTLQYVVGFSEMIESLVLHENKATTLSATAHILPDLRLEVEGPRRHAMLKAWIESLQKLLTQHGRA